MRIGVVGNSGGWSSEALADAFGSRTGYRCLIDLEHVRFDLDTGTASFRDYDLSRFDALVIKKVGRNMRADHLDRLEMLRFLHGRGVPIFSDPLRILRVLNRLACTVTLTLHGIPMPRTVVTESIGHAVETVRSFRRAVFKPLYSTKAKGMQIVADDSNTKEAVQAFRDAGNPTMYIQQFVELPGQDLGIAFLGGEYIGTYARVQTRESWNTSTNSGGKYAATEPTPETIELAFQAQKPFGLDFTCVDVAILPGGPVVFEVSAFGGFRGLSVASGVDVASRYADYVMKKIQL